MLYREIENKVREQGAQLEQKINYQQVDEKIALAKLEGANVDTSTFTVKSELENSIKNGNIYVSFGVWENGFVTVEGNPTTTENWNFAKRTRDFHTVNKNVTYTFKATNGANCIIRKYNSEKVIVGSINTSSILNVKFDDCDYIKLAINNADSSAIIQSEKNVVITSSYEGVFALDEKYRELLQNNSSLLKDYFQAIPTGANEITINTTDKIIYFPRCYIYSNGKLHTTTIETTLSYSSLTTFIWVYANTSTKNIELLSNYSNTSNMLFLGLIPIQSERINLSHVHFSYKIIGQNSEENNSIYKGKTFAVIGDSISTFVGISEDSQGGVSYRKEYYPSVTANINTYSDMWWGIVQDKLGMIRTGVSAISQSCYRTQNDNTRLEGYADERINRLSTDGVPDYIFIALATNDGYNSYSVDYDGTIDKDTLLASGTKTAPACALTILKIQEKYPNAKIIVVIPKFCNITKLGYSSTTFMKVCEGIKSIANILGVYKVIDLRKCGINYANVDLKTIDGIHPNNLGMLDMGNYVVEELNN